MPRSARSALPVHFMAGGFDVKFTELARTMSAAVPNARVTIVPGAGHNLVHERPAEIAAALQFKSNNHEGAFYDSRRYPHASASHLGNVSGL